MREGCENTNREIKMMNILLKAESRPKDEDEN
jgi:hypothetical protein